ncbi:ABC transporter permease [Acidihalobacter ferrooxydans]|uniref:ABC transmembrane type-2 domain-containing protein n=1 Tax=Acidihalobacter ferrooxydans TaxID=1765967 RepID=A0A1P8UJI6_9GAMM|nr:ABC transporter permease [Acidihalobacter ferrooxydans]APZ43998.1 hypothetical protein BW247_13610 [Acidihalobacter ferrooxydans]
MMRWLAVLRLELARLMQMKKTRMVLLATPLIPLIVFGYGVNYDLTRIPYAVYNEDAGYLSRDLVARFAADPTFHRVARLQNDRQIRPLLDKRRAAFVLHIDANYTRNLLTHRPAPVEVLIDARNATEASTIESYVNHILLAYNAQWAVEHHHPPAPALLVIHNWYNANLDSRWFILPGIVGVLTFVLTLMVTVPSFARDREQGLFDSYRALPLRAFDLLVGKGLAGMAVGFLGAAFIALMAVVWFGVPLRGSIAALFVGLLVFLFAASGMGLWVSTLTRTQMQAAFGLFLLFVPALLLSGFIFPISKLSAPVQTLSLLDPVRYFLTITRGVYLQGAGFATTGPAMASLAVLGSVAWVGAWLTLAVQMRPLGSFKCAD